MVHRGYSLDYFTSLKLCFLSLSRIYCLAKYNIYRTTLLRRNRLYLTVQHPYMFIRKLLDRSV